MALAYRAIASALGLAGLCAFVPAWSKDAPAGDVANGKRAYLAVGCFSCHGRSGQGGAFNYPAPPLAHTQLPVEAFKTIVRAGPNDMPAYGEAVLSDHDLADIYAFVRSLPGPRPPKEIPLLDR
ncbi:MAG TPA: cytochrome c [Burkholderiaceae bacterium]|jgi:mono/diheme cytochrome c family protein|nr:cytochrome c [Burkholderiaceae bacterium]